MAGWKVVIKGQEELTLKMRHLAKDARPMLVRATEKAVLYLHSRVPPPPVPSRKPYPFVSERQRRFVMALVRRGDVPYRRTNQMVASINTKVKSLGGGVVGTIGTNHVKAPWVISEERVGGRGPQARYHQGTWWTLQEVARKSWDGVLSIYRRMLSDWLE